MSAVKVSLPPWATEEADQVPPMTVFGVDNRFCWAVASDSHTEAVQPSGEHDGVTSRLPRLQLRTPLVVEVWGAR